MGEARTTRSTIGLGGVAALLLISGLAVLPTAALDTDAPIIAEVAPETVLAAVNAPCPGTPMPSPDKVVQGEFGTELEGSYVLVPFDVPAEIGGAAVTAVRAKYCFDQPELPTNARIRNTLDLGLYEPRADPAHPWGVEEFRGWGGSSHPDVTVSADGFEAADGATTRAFLPGPIEPGKWAAELGVAAVTSRAEGDFDGRVAWRVELDYLTDPRFADEPYETTPCDAGGRCPIASSSEGGPGWYAGDLHVHGEHSALNDAPLEEVFGYAFCPDPDLGAVCDPEYAKPGAGLDFITLSDYVGGSHWGEIGRYQADYPGKLIIPSAEVITYGGHTNAHGITKQVDYRTGPLYEWEGSGGTTKLRDARPPEEIFDSVHGRVSEPGFTQINHPTIFPSQVPGFDSVCRGCSWDYSAEATDYSKVDAIEIATGPAGLQDFPGNPGPNPFTTTAIQFWESAIDADGHNSNRIAAVGVSDSHNAGERNDPVTQAPIGQATTVVHADELSAAGIQRGVLAGHTYVKVWGTSGPDLRLEARDPDDPTRPPAMIGDSIEADELEFTARVLNLERARAARSGAYLLAVLRDGAPYLVAPIPAGGDEFEFEFPSSGPGRYRLQVQRTAEGAGSIEAVSSPIYHDAPTDSGSPGGPPARGGGGATAGPVPGGAGSPGPQGEGAPLCRRGGPGRDRLRADPGGECLRGRGGPDRLRGGLGDDRLHGGGGADLLSGARGGDVLDARADGRDRVRCGPGDDVVLADRRDRVGGDCEILR